MNKVKCKNEEYNMNIYNDEFYKKNLFSNYGEVATNLKSEVESLTHSKKSMNIKNFDDM